MNSIKNKSKIPHAVERIDARIVGIIILDGFWLAFEILRPIIVVGIS